MGKKVYIASRFGDRFLLRATYRKVLKDMGFEVTSRWLDLPDNVTFTEEDTTRHAFNDLLDIQRSDIVIIDNSPSPNKSLGGMWVELGYALSQHSNKVVLYIGKLQSAFCYLIPERCRFLTWGKLLTELGERYGEEGVQAGKAT